jgi:hypothetical protein
MSDLIVPVDLSDPGNPRRLAKAHDSIARRASFKSEFCFANETALFSKAQTSIAGGGYLHGLFAGAARGIHFRRRRVRN